jgi:hypothetical protein
MKLYVYGYVDRATRTPYVIQTRYPIHEVRPVPLFHDGASPDIGFLYALYQL